jgi:hypothetical protein
MYIYPTKRKTKPCNRSHYLPTLGHSQPLGVCRGRSTKVAIGGVSRSDREKEKQQGLCKMARDIHCTTNMYSKYTLESLV